MRLIIRRDTQEVGAYTASYIVGRIRAFEPTASRPFVLGLPTGSSPLATYQELIRAFERGQVSFQHVVTFNMDEYIGLPADSPQSYRTFMFENFFNYIDIPKENINILNGNASNLALECAAYERKIKSFGGVELFLGGCGTDGHLAFNEPGSSLGSRTRVKTLAEETVLANARFFDDNPALVPRMCLTVGVATVMEAREVIIIVTGQSKALALSKCVEEGVNHLYTVSTIQLHPQAMVVCDDAATGELRVKTVRYFKQIEQTQEECAGILRANGKANGSH